MKTADLRKASELVVGELERLKQRIIANMYSANAVASGRTIRSLKVVPTENGAMLISEQRMPFGTLETGRRGYPYPESEQHIPRGFARIIYEWMQTKGIHGDPIPYKTNRPHKYTPQERGDQSMAYLTARKIATQGTRLFRNGGRDGIYSNEIPETIERIQARFGEIVQAYIANQIKLNNLQ